jgi:NAD kinase
MASEPSDNDSVRMPSKAGFRLVASINGAPSPIKRIPTSGSDLAPLSESDHHEEDHEGSSDLHRADSHSIEPYSAQRSHKSNLDSFSFPEVDPFEVLDHEVERSSDASDMRRETETERERERDFAGVRSPFSRLSVRSRASINSRNSANARNPSLFQTINQIKRSNTSEIKLDVDVSRSTLLSHPSGGGGAWTSPSATTMKKSSSFKLFKTNAAAAPSIAAQTSLSSMQGSPSKADHHVIEPVFDSHGDPVCRWQTSLTSALEAGNVGDSSAVGSTLTLEWITPPRTALVVCKLAPHVWPSFLSVLKWMRMRGIIAWVEPAMWKVAVDAGVAGALDEGEMELLPPRISAVDRDGGRKELAVEEQKDSPVRTWAARSLNSEEGGSIPDPVVENLDFAVVLGGDGTLLWTCHIFGNRAVPPVLPFNMGSLGFLTPFDPSEIDLRLGQVAEGGFPMILRHRLHCVIMRASQSSQGGCGIEDSMWEDGRCKNEKVVLNEMVVDRGTAPYLANIEAFCDGECPYSCVISSSDNLDCFFSQETL